MARTEKRIPSVLKSIDALKRSMAKAALLAADDIKSFQKSRDLIAANMAWERALLHADVSPIVMESYRRLGVHHDPLTAYLECGYQSTIEKSRS